MDYRPGRLRKVLIYSVRFSASAETPFLAAANCQHAWNHTVSGVRRRSKMVPDVTAVWAL